MIPSRRGPFLTIDVVDFFFWRVRSFLCPKVGLGDNVFFPLDEKMIPFFSLE